MPLTVPELDRAYELIADAIDRTPPEEEADFLARLALALAAQLEAIGKVEDAVKAATAAACPPA